MSTLFTYRGVRSVCGNIKLYLFKNYNTNYNKNYGKIYTDKNFQTQPFDLIYNNELFLFAIPVLF